MVNGRVVVTFVVTVVLAVVTDVEGLMVVTGVSGEHSPVMVRSPSLQTQKSAHLFIAITLVQLHVG